LGTTQLWNFNNDNNGSPALLTAAGGAISLAGSPGIVNPAHGGLLLPSVTTNAFYIGPFAQNFTPALAGSTGAGTPAYTAQTGDFWDNGSSVTVNFRVALSGAFTGATGTVLVTGFPRAPIGALHHDGACTINSESAITISDTGYSALTAGVAGTGLAQAVVIEIGGAVPTQPLPVSTIGSGAIIGGSCTYRWN
jgi:hypothetical protein